MNGIELGRTIHVGRICRGLDQTEFAPLAGISVSYLSLLEHGKRDPSLSTLASIAGALGIPLSVLVFLAENDSAHDVMDDELRQRLELEAFRLLRNTPGGQQ